MSCITYLNCIAENFYAAERFYLHRLHFLAFCNYLQNEYKTGERRVEHCFESYVSIQYLRNCNACIQVFFRCNIIHADHSNSLCRSMPKWIHMVAAAYSISYRFYDFVILQRAAISAVSKSLWIVMRALGTTICVKIENAVRIFMTTRSLTVLISIQWHYLRIILSTLNLFLQSQLGSLNYWFAIHLMKHKLVIWWTLLTPVVSR